MWLDGSGTSTSINGNGSGGGDGEWIGRLHGPRADRYGLLIWQMCGDGGRGAKVSEANLTNRQPTNALVIYFNSCIFHSAPMARAAAMALLAVCCC